MSPRAPRAPKPVVELNEAKLSVPAARSGIVFRSALVERLSAPPHPQVVSVVAPAGYGKTTLLAQWAGRDRRPFVWVHVDDRDNDPMVLLSYVVEGLDRVEPVGEPVLRALAAPSTSIWSTVVPRLGAALALRRKPFVLVLDDVQELRSTASLDAVTAISRHLPDRSQMALVGRSEPGLPVERLRLADELLELGAAELALSPGEARTLLEQAGVELDEDGALALHRRTEGWAAGLYLAALALRHEAGDAATPSARVAGDDRFITDYLRLEHLSRVSPKQLRFLTRTAVLDRMCGDLCDAVVGRRDSARMLETIEHSNLFLTPLDHRRTWYRYHELFRDVLRAELGRREPVRVPELYRRAADWCEANEFPEAALHYAYQGGDTDRAARLISTLALPLYRSGRMATVEEWFDRLQLRADEYPAAGVIRTWLHILRGRPADAERWLDAVERSSYDGPMPDGSTSIEPWVGMLRALMCPSGVERMRADAELAVSELAPFSPWRPTALLLLGIAFVLEGDYDAADLVLARTAEAAEADGATYAQAVALSERALIALEKDEVAAAVGFVRDARAIVDDDRLNDYVPTAILMAASARVALRSGDRRQAHADLVRAQRLRPLLTTALPWHAVQTLVELTRAQLAFGDTAGAATLLNQAREVLRARPCLGVLVDQVAELRHKLASYDAGASGWASSLTAAELRLLPLLSTHLTFREIGERLFVSRNTVKTQAISIYRKLDVSSRGDAVARAADLGLVETAAHSPVEDFTLSG